MTFTESWPLGEPVRQRRALAGGKAEWDEAASGSADLVETEVVKCLGWGTEEDQAKR